ncbi:enoyl-CoA hydratase/isomerase family protein [Sneathiella aquimaris]|uniref:enoyl-CoA hydratase/isomerase family protein n=1 Tax=Sneathiella aquimaris TaxID=2599305 RepID=UPI00146E5222|nr:enoyl-CoA hydratase/isomerase family protein [Sneathiella aquimaris]
MGTFFSSDQKDHVLTVTLNKPEQHNVLNPKEMAALSDHLEVQANNDDIRVGVLTATGKSFCAGADLGELKDYNFSANPLEILSNRIESLPFPVICKLNGGVYGGGTDLALACDFRVGTTAMKCFIPPAKIGIHYHASGMARAVSRLGLGPAKRLFLALETMRGSELKEIGFLDYLAQDADQLEQKTQALAADLLALAPLSLRGMKATFNDIARSAFDADAAVQRQIKCLESDDFAEGRAALAEKRAAQFKGV